MTDPNLPITLSPARYPANHRCQIMIQSHMRDTPKGSVFTPARACDARAVADCALPDLQTWAFVCKHHLETMGPYSRAFVTNLLDTPLEFVLRQKEL